MGSTSETRNWARIRSKDEPSPRAIYFRGSSDRHTIENQRTEVEQLARAREYAIALYEETESAAKRRLAAGCPLHLIVMKAAFAT